MSDALRRLKREAKRARHLLLPVFEHARLRHAVEGGVYFHSADPLGVETKHFFCRNLFRVETSLPLFVAVAAGADVEIHQGRVAEWEIELEKKATGGQATFDFE